MLNQIIAKYPKQAPDLGSTVSDPAEGEMSSIFNLLRGKKFLAAVVTGSCIGKSLMTPPRAHL